MGVRVTPEVRVHPRLSNVGQRRGNLFIMTNLFIQNTVKNDFMMTLSFSHENLKGIIKVKERYTGGILEMTQSQHSGIIKSNGHLKLIEDCGNLRDLGTFIDREFSGLDTLLENPVFRSFLPVLDELEENAIYNLELVDWFSGLGFEELGIQYEIEGNVHILPYPQNLNQLRLKNYDRMVLQIV